MNIVETQEVKKSFFKKSALNGIDLTIKKGSITGLLGPNGSGKTTYLKLLAGLLRPTSGSIMICDMEISYKTKEIVAYLPDSDFLYPWMKISDAQKVYSTFFRDFNQDKFNGFLDFMKLENDMVVKSLSKGMKEKLALSLTLSRDAKLFILDEPLNGVDPIAREEILGAVIKGFDVEGAMLITSHLVDEIERVLDTVYFIKEGSIVLSGDCEDLRNKHNLTLDGLYREVLA